MDLLSLSSFPAALLVWQLTPARWVITVVCKATYALTPGVVGAASEQEPIQEEDAHWDDDPKRSLFAPSDLVPFKTRADVMLVGSAFARNGQPARSITVRLNVGSIDKSIEVLCPRVRTRDGELREGKRWTKMPLLYERAAGGPGTENPVGVSLEGARDPYGQLALPNLQPPGLHLPMDKLPPPIGFGPIAARWPARATKVPKGHDDRDWARAPFGEGFEPSYFQAAPADQQIDALRPTERIALDNLLAKHPVFVTSLPGDKLRARVETRGTAPREVTLVPDTLWIDTDRGICTVTHRGKIDVDHPEQEGRILVASTRTDQPIPWAKLAPAPPAPSSQSTPPPPAGSVAVGNTPVGSAGVGNVPVGSVPVGNNAPPGKGAVPGLVVSPGAAPKPPPPARRSSIPAPPPPGAPPARAAVSRSVPPAKVDVGAARVPPPPALDEPPDSRDEPRTVDIDLEIADAVEVTMTEAPARSMTQTAALRPITAPGSMLVSEVAALPFQPAPPGWTPPAAVPSRPGLPPLPGVPADLTTTPVFGAPTLSAPTFGLPGSAPTLRATIPDPHEAVSPPDPPPIAPPPLITSPAWNALTPVKPVPIPGAAPVENPLGALEASNVAAGLADLARAEPPRFEAETALSPQPQTPAAVAVELIWFDPAAALRLATSALPVAQAPADAPQDPRSAEDRARAAVYDVLTRRAPTAAGTLESVLESAEDDSPPSPALSVVAGTLELALDEIETLRAVTAAASPLAASDKKLKEVIDVAAEMLKTSMQGMPDFAEGLSSRIRDAWSRANRALPPDHLTSCTERLLLEQRAYQKRELLDDTWIRALLTGDGPAIPVYLPASIAKRLPLFRRFPVRLFAEVVWQQDQYETHPIALRALAIGRISPRSRKRGPAARR